MAALHAQAAAAFDPPQGRAIEERKDDLMRQLAICESGGHGNSWHWPACSRKLGLARHVTEIKAVTVKRTDVRAHKGEPDGD